MMVFVEQSVGTGSLVVVSMLMGLCVLVPMTGTDGTANRSGFFVKIGNNGWVVAYCIQCGDSRWSL